MFTSLFNYQGSSPFNGPGSILWGSLHVVFAGVVVTVESVIAQVDSFYELKYWLTPNRRLNERKYLVREILNECILFLVH